MTERRPEGCRLPSWSARVPHIIMQATTMGGANQWTRFSRPVAKMAYLLIGFGAQCRFIMEARRGSAKRLPTYSSGVIDL